MAGMSVVSLAAPMGFA